jgi:hypothetical protein
MTFSVSVAPAARTWLVGGWVMAGWENNELDPAANAARKRKKILFKAVSD